MKQSIDHLNAGLEPAEKNQQIIFQQPAADPNFTGREIELAQLKAGFSKKKGSVIIQSITGACGMGKTALAAYYAQAACKQDPKVQTHYNAIIWWQADIPIGQQFQALAKTLNLPHKTEKAAIASVYQRLQHHTTLMVFDNLPPDASLALFLPPKSHKAIFHCMVTTRKLTPQQTKNTYPSITLGSFDHKTGCQYIQNVLKSDESKEQNPAKQAMNTLVDLVGGLPLALSEAMRYITSGKSTVEAYPKVFQAHQLRLGGAEDESPLMTRVLLSLLALEAKYPAVSSIAIHMSYLDAKPLPEALLKQAPELQDLDEVAYQAGLEALEAQGLILRKTDKISWLSMHPMTQAVMRQWHLIQQGSKAQTDLLTGWMVYFTQKLSHDQKADQKKHQRLSVYMPHAWAVARFQGSAVSSCLGLQADLCEAIGNHQSILRQYGMAQKAFQRTVMLLTKHYGLDHLQTVPALMCLGHTSYIAGDLKAAHSQYSQGLAILEACYGKGHIQTVQVLLNLGNVLQELGDLDAAKCCYQNAWDIQKTLFQGDEHIRTVEARTALSSVLVDLVELKTAKTLAEGAVKTLISRYGAQHVKTADALFNLGRVFHSTGDFKKAKARYNQVLTILEKYYGRGHIQTAAVLVNLGSVLGDLRNWKKAKQYCQFALKILEDHYGKDSIQTAGARVNLGRVLYHLKDLAGAKVGVESALKQMKTQCPDNHPHRLLGEGVLEALVSKKKITVKAIVLKQVVSYKVYRPKESPLQLAKAMYDFVKAMEVALKNIPVPKYLGKAWTQASACNFVSTTLKGIRSQMLPIFLKDSEKYGLPTCIVSYIRNYVKQHPKLQLAKYYPFVCRKLEIAFCLGKIDSLDSCYAVVPLPKVPSVPKAQVASEAVEAKVEDEPHKGGNKHQSVAALALAQKKLAGSLSNKRYEQTLKNRFQKRHGHIKRKNLVGQWEGQPMCFDEYEVKDDGNCGFIALGLDRKTSVLLLLSQQNDLTARQCLAKEIMQEFTPMAQDNALKVVLEAASYKQLQNLHQAFLSKDRLLGEACRSVRQALREAGHEALLKEEAGPEQLMKLTEQLADSSLAKRFQSAYQAHQKAYQDFQSACAQKAVFIQYVAQGLGGQLFLGVESALLLAKMKHISVFIWRENRGRLAIYKSHVQNHQSQGIVHMIHTRGFTHFNFLVVAPNKPKPAKSNNIAAKPQVDDGQILFTNLSEREGEEGESMVDSSQLKPVRANDLIQAVMGEQKLDDEDQVEQDLNHFKQMDKILDEGYEFLLEKQENVLYIRLTNWEDMAIKPDKLMEIFHALKTDLQNIIEDQLHLTCGRKQDVFLKPKFSEKALAVQVKQAAMIDRLLKVFLEAEFIEKTDLVSSNIACTIL